jgi:serine/threonine-protein kinase
LPLIGVKQPAGVAADAAGNLYVSDLGNNQVLKLSAGARSPSVLPVHRP